MSNFESSFSSDDPRFWLDVHNEIGHVAPPDPNAVIKSALASEAFIADMLENDTPVVFTRRVDGTIEERGEL